MARAYNALPSLATLDERLEADFTSGKLYWRTMRHRPGWAGREAGWTDDGGYGKVRIDGVTYQKHRIIYAMYHRADPGNLEIDHLNGVFDDNRIVNIRLATRDMNCANRHGWRKGLRGAYAKAGRWMSVIQIENKRMYLGHFDTEEDAHAAFRAASVKHYGALARLD